MDETLLESLPQEHPLRTRALIDIGAEYKARDAKAWRKVLPTFKIAGCCFNDLGPAWVSSTTWRATTAS